jgi:hypothetical protein
MSAVFFASMPFQRKRQIVKGKGVEFLTSTHTSKNED